MFHLTNGNMKCKVKTVEIDGICDGSGGAMGGSSLFDIFALLLNIVRSGKFLSFLYLITVALQITAVKLI